MLGTRVCAPWKDGFFYSGIIEAVKSKPAGENTYTILFDDGYIAEVDEEEIVGPGFANPGTVQLRKGQLVYVFFKGKEVAATVCKSNAEFGEVLVFPKHEHNKAILAVKASEVHLTRGQQYSREEGLQKKISKSVFCPVTNKVKHGATKNRYYANSSSIALFARISRTGVDFLANNKRQQYCRIARFWL